MNADPENFDSLMQLLALKKYEQPPPGYFNRLPGQILARLESQEEEAGFWGKLFSGLVVRPALAYSVGLAFCGAFATGIFYAFQVQPTEVASESNGSQGWEYAGNSELASQKSSASSLHVTGYNAFDTNTGTHTLPSLFNDPELNVVPVSYTH